MATSRKFKARGRHFSYTVEMTMSLAEPGTVHFDAYYTGKHAAAWSLNVGYSDGKAFLMGPMPENGLDDTDFLWKVQDELNMLVRDARMEQILEG